MGCLSSILCRVCCWPQTRWVLLFIVYYSPMTSIQERLFQVLMQMGKSVKLTISGADLNGRNAVESYVEREGELVGCIKLVKLWHAIGHTVRHIWPPVHFPLQRLQSPPYRLILSSLDPSSQRPQLPLLRCNLYHFWSTHSWRRLTRVSSKPWKPFTRKFAAVTQLSRPCLLSILF